MRKKDDPISEGNDHAAETRATRVSSPKNRTPTPHSKQPSIVSDSDLPTIALDAPSEVQIEALTARLKTGDRIGKNKRFEITGRLGAGGMGLVFAAVDHQLNRSVAIKFILPDPRISWNELVKILRHEAMATARLRHDNIVAIFDIATWKRLPYLVMEHLQGESLAQVLDGGRVGLLRATEVMMDVASGISHAHENGIIHRDLKPGNVFVLKEGRAKVLDFGLAAFAQLRSQPPVSGDESSLTAGTPAFMAPEQWRGALQDERTDIWAMGVMLFQLFTGQRPYPSKDALGLYKEVCSEQPAPSVLSVQDDLPEQAEMIVARAMEKKPEARFQTAAQLLEALVGFRNFLVRSPGAKREARRSVQRRQLTFLSCGLTSPATEDADEEEESISKLTALCADVINTLDGRLVAVLGNKVLACFGHPVAREGDAERAVRAGLQMVEEVRRASGQRPSSPRVRVGIHTGLEIVEDIEGQPEAFHVQGSTPQIAASLERQADENAVVIGHSTQLLTRGVFDLEDRGSSVVEGSSQPMAAYRVLRKRDIDNRFDVTFASRQIPLVGREADVERLVDLWHSAKNSMGHFALLTGEAGIGKSRLVRVLKDRVGSDGGARMSCQCWPQFKSSAFHAIIELLLRSTEILREDSTEQKLAKLESSLSTLGMDPAESMPVIGSLLSIPLPGASSFFLDPRERKKKTIDALTAMVLALAAQRPLLFVAEDLHWADHSTLELLGSLLGPVASARILVLGTARPEFRASWPKHPHFHDMPISHLPPRLAAKMVERTAGDNKLPADVIETLVQKTEGVPLFIEEMTRALVESVGVGRDNEVVDASVLARAIPATLNELLLARLDRLTTAGKEVAQIASVVGRSFPYSLIQRMSGIGGSALHNALLSLSEADVLLCQGRPPDSKYQFRHFLIQDAAYHSLPKKKRREHHFKVAEVLLELRPETAEIQPELLAHHYTEAGDVERALTHWERAGRRAAERSANVEAINHFSQAIHMLMKFPEDTDRNRRELSLQLALGAPLMAVKGYAAPEVEKAYGRARELCRSASEDIQLFPAMHGLWQFYMVGGKLPAALELAEQLLGVAQNTGDSTLLLLAYRSLATTAFLEGQIVRCRDLTEMGLALYDRRRHSSLGLRYGHDPGVAHGLYAAWALWLLGYPEQALKKAIEAVAWAESLSHPVSVAFARGYLAVVRNSCGQYVEAAADAAAAKAISNAHQLALWLSVATMMEGWARFGLGESVEGIAQFEHGVAEWRRTGASAGMTFFLVTLAEAYRKTGRFKEGMDVLDEAEALVARNSEHYYEAELYRVKGELRFALAPQDEVAADAEIKRAVSIARQQEARALQLRATTSLCGLPQRRSRPQETRQVLYEIYQSFSEGLDTADLVVAKAALEALADAQANTSPY